MRQASRRSWRIGQTRPVKVVFMAYRNALKLVAQKLQSSLAVEGELPDDGLAAYGDDGDDLMLALARKLVADDEGDSESVESIFAQAQQVAADAESLLVDDSWRPVELTPELAAVIDLPAVSVEPAVTAIPCGHHVGVAPQQQDLFSWAEFLSNEPTPTKRRSRKQAQPSASLFEWALEQEQQAGLAGGGWGQVAARAGPRSSRGRMTVRCGRWSMRRPMCGEGAPRVWRTLCALVWAT